MRLFTILALATVVAMPTITCAQPKDATILMKDGSTVRGKVRERRDYITDPASGAVVTVPAAGAFMYLDDDVRKVFFSPSQVQEIITSKPGDTVEPITFKRVASTVVGRDILVGWNLESTGPWNDNWERILKFNVPKRGPLEMKQRMVKLTPQVARVQTIEYEWDVSYQTSELNPELVKKLIVAHLAAAKEFKSVTDFDKRIQVARFLFQAGWIEYADVELTGILKDFPEQKEAVKTMRDTIDVQRATLFVEEIEKANKTGRHIEARKRIDYYTMKAMAPLVTDKQRLYVQDLQNVYQSTDEKLAKAKELLRALPRELPVGSRIFWNAVLSSLIADLNIDTLARYETFVTYAAQHLREMEQKAKPSQETEEVLALAITAWLQGAAEPDAKLAKQLLVARKFVVDYQKVGSAASRRDMLNTWTTENDITPDVLARVIRLAPPPFRIEKVTTDIVKLDIGVFGADAGSYLLKLPPEYTPTRSYPLLLVLGTGREKLEEIVIRLSGLATQYGFIIAAPFWAKASDPTYGYTDAEQRLVLDTLRDVRSRVQVDSDRVYLFGWEQGGVMAFDIGLSHPDQFAAVVPINGRPGFFCKTYWSNAQYLPFYIVEGERNGINSKVERLFFKDWVQSHYASLYVEFNGRTSEWFTGEMPAIFDWMNRKKRQHPIRELGIANPAGGSGGEEFKTMRRMDNHFYFLSTNTILAKNLNDISHFSPTTRPATLQANVFVGNQIVMKAGGQVKGAQVWTQIDVRASGVKDVTVWLSPAMVDFTKPIQIRVNLQPIGPPRVITPSIETLMEEFVATGDRESLFFAKVEVKL